MTRGGAAVWRMTIDRMAAGMRTTCGAAAGTRCEATARRRGGATARRRRRRRDGAAAERDTG